MSWPFIALIAYVLIASLAVLFWALVEMRPRVRAGELGWPQALRQSIVSGFLGLPFLIVFSILINLTSILRLRRAHSWLLKLK